MSYLLLLMLLTITCLQNLLNDDTNLFLTRFGPHHEYFMEKSFRWKLESLPCLLMDHFDETGCKLNSQNSYEALREFQLPPACLGSELCKIYLLSNLKMGTKARRVCQLACLTIKALQLHFLLFLNIKNFI